MGRGASRQGRRARDVPLKSVPQIVQRKLDPSTKQKRLARRARKAAATCTKPAESKPVQSSDKASEVPETQVQQTTQRPDQQEAVSQPARRVDWGPRASCTHVTFSTPSETDSTRCDHSRVGRNRRVTRRNRQQKFVSRCFALRGGM